MMSGIPYIVRRQGHGSSHELARHPIYAGAPPELWQSLIAQALAPWVSALVLERWGADAVLAAIVALTILNVGAIGGVVLLRRQL